MMLVLCPSNSPGHAYMGSWFEFRRGGGAGVVSGQYVH